MCRSARSRMPVALLQHGVPAGAEIERHDAGRVVGRAGAKHDAVAVRPHRAEFGERAVSSARNAPCAQIQHRQMAQTRLRVGADDPIGCRRTHRSTRRITLRLPELGRFAYERLGPLLPAGP